MEMDCSGNWRVSFYFADGTETAGFGKNDCLGTVNIPKPFVSANYSHFVCPSLDWVSRTEVPGLQ